MGWGKSPAYFCAAPKTARYISKERAITKIGSLPEHPLEKHTMKTLSTALSSKPLMMQLSGWIIDVHVNKNIGMAQNKSIDLLRNIARAILTPIHEVFVPPHMSVHKGGDSVAIKKLIKG